MSDKPLFHRLWLGDSVELLKTLPKGVVNCVITDPPFGVDNQSNQSVTQAGKQYATKILNDESPEQAIQIFKDVWASTLPALCDTCDVYIFTSYQVLSEWLVMTDELLGKSGFERKAVIWWEKDGPGMGDLTIPWGMGSEAVLFFRRGKMDLKTTRRNSTVHVSQVRPGQLIHPHQKPEPLLELFIKASTDRNDFVLDMFGGSSSLARACRNTGRSCLTIELDPIRYNRAVEEFNRTSGGGLFTDE